MEDFNPAEFVQIQIEKIEEVVGGEKALIAVSGGVDSSTCAVLTHMAIGENLICVILDDAFMRMGEPEWVAGVLSKPPLNLPVRIERVQERFLNALRGLRDAEEKRKAFRKTFYETLSEIAKREKIRYLVQGTILADIIETKSGVKTQHNVLEQVGINTRELYGFKVVEPLVSLLKWQVREVARYLKIPPEISERQPFPGPGLSVRTVGEVRPDKLATLKKATKITENKLSKYNPSQYFAAIIDDEEKVPPLDVKEIIRQASEMLNLETGQVQVKVFADRATGVRGESRVYGDILALNCSKDGREILEVEVPKLVALQEAIINRKPQFTRVLYAVAERKVKKPYVIAIRAVETKDFLTAKVSPIPWSTLEETAETILEKCPKVSTVYYDVTPKPPATIEME
ncbi:MAG: GMP synthase [Candidatus Bathyarchaeota archaeon B26-1]|nr:MAG: GMP synthase [Candidatus Bathyarchaeota archaeon B26-1]